MPQQKQSKRLLLSGYYGYGNAGDEAVLAGLIAGFRAASADAVLSVLSGAPSETRAAHGIAAVDRYRPAALLPAIARCDLFLSGGGSLLQDVSSAHSIFYYLGVVKMAQMLGKKTMFAAQGIGPLTLPRSRKLVAAVAGKLDAITVRDPGSAALLREIGVSRPSIEVTADPGPAAACAKPPKIRHVVRCRSAPLARTGRARLTSRRRLPVEPSRPDTAPAADAAVERYVYRRAVCPRVGGAAVPRRALLHDRRLRAALVNHRWV